MKKYILTGENIDIRYVYNSEEEAKAKLKEWIEDDKKEFGKDTSDEYYITETEITRADFINEHLAYLDSLGSADKPMSAGEWEKWIREEVNGLRDHYGYVESFTDTEIGWLIDELNERKLVK